MQGIQIVGPLAAPTNIATTATAASTTIIADASYKMVPEVDVYWNIWGTASSTAGELAVAEAPVHFLANGRTALSLIAKSATGNVKLTRVGSTLVF